jgi:two-component system cell cycle sensor histidine kinase/response regulator CckA
MDVDTLGHIFEPFFSTREPGIGSGMGLATVDGIVRQSGGFVLVESAPGAGSTFRIHLPRIEQGTPPAQQDEDGGIPRLAGQETILVVEDDRMVRTFVRRTLASIGYAVLDAASGDEALALSRSTVRIDLLLTDMRMPGLQGRRLAEMLTESRPGLAVIFMTGFDEETVRDGLQRPADARVVMKPFTSETLAHVVREALDGRP